MDGRDRDRTAPRTTTAPETDDRDTTACRTTTDDRERTARRTTAAPATDDRERTARRTTTAPETDDRFAVSLRGVAVDDETRCRHWHDAVDVIALRFACCGTYYPSAACHAETTDHEPERWPRDRFGESAVLCGVCRTTLTVDAYLDCGDTCPACGTAFNPGCRAHRHLYFEP